MLSQGGNPADYVATNLTATQTGAAELVGHDAGDRAIYLHEVSPTVLEGRTAGADGIPGNSDDFVAFRITLDNANNPATATITVDQFMAIDHGGAEDPSIFDENLILRLADGASLGLKLDVALTDFDGDPASDSATVTLATNDGSFISFDDDGPTVSGSALVLGDCRRRRSDRPVRRKHRYGSARRNRFPYPLRDRYRPGRCIAATRQFRLRWPASHFGFRACYADHPV